MPDFQYKAKASNGAFKNGKITAPSEAAARAKLSALKLKPISLKASSATPNAQKVSSQPAEASSRPLIGDFVRLGVNAQGKSTIEFGSGLPATKELAVFTKQFSLMIERSIPLIQTLAILAEQQRLPRFAGIINSVRLKIENGSTLSDALAEYPKVFDTLFISMIKAGEISGGLDKIMRQLTNYIEKSAKLKSQLKSAMAYPTIILAVAVGVVTLLLVYVVPLFAKQFTDSGNKLPALTQFVVDMSNFMVSSWYVLIFSFIAGMFALNYWRQTEKGAIKFDELLLKSPVVGDVIQKVAVGRFCSTMSTMLMSGVSIIEALNICAASAGNKTIEAFVLNVRDKISGGSTFAEPLFETNLFPRMVGSMVQVGEQTGALDQTLSKIAEIYEDEVDVAVDTMKSMIEPIMIVFIGGFVGFIVIAMYLPIFEMASNVGK